MTDLLLYFAASFGFAYVVGHSAISLPARILIGGPADNPKAVFGFLVALVECPACLGTWTGAAAGLFRPELFTPTSSLVVAATIGAFSTAGVNFILGKSMGLMPMQPQDNPKDAMLRALSESLPRLIENLERQDEEHPVMRTLREAALAGDIHWAPPGGMPSCGISEETPPRPWAAATTDGEQHLVTCKKCLEALKAVHQ